MERINVPLLCVVVLYGTASKASPQDEELEAFISTPGYINRLAAKEQEIYSTLLHYHKLHTDNLNPDVLAYLEPYLEDYGTSSNGSQDAFHHPFLAFRLLFRFVKYVHPIIDRLTLTGNSEGILAMLRNSSGLEYPNRENGTFRASDAILRIQEVFEYKASDLQQGRFGITHTNVTLGVDHIHQLIKDGLQLNYFVQIMDWLRTWEHLYMDKAEVQSWREKIVTTHNKRFIPNRTSDWFSSIQRFSFSSPLTLNSNTTSPPSVKRVEMENWLGTGGGSGSLMERNLTALALCSNSTLLQRNPPRSNLKCWLDDKKDPYFLVAPLKTELIWDDPEILMFHDVVSDSWANDAMALAQPWIDEYIRELGEFDEPTSEAYVDENDLPVFQKEKFSTKLGLITGGARLGEDERVENYRMVAYNLGGTARVHRDGLIRPPGDGGGEPVVDVLMHSSVLLYLTDVQLGGETLFVDIPLSIRPKKGSVVYWKNFKRNGEPILNSWHTTCPTILGTRWILSLFVNRRDFCIPCV